MKPSIGRIVHYTAEDLDGAFSHFAAIITHVWSDTCVNLYVFPKGTPHHETCTGVQISVVLGSEDTGGKWHWPERVE